MLNTHALAAGFVLLLLLQGTGATSVIPVPCAASGPACGAALQAAIEQAPPGATLTLEPGRVYEGTINIRPKEGARVDAPLTITTRGWRGGGEGWDGLVTPADKPAMAVLRGARGEPVAFYVRSGENSGFVRLVGVAFEATPPEGRGDVIRIGSGLDRDPEQLPQHVTIQQVLIQGDRAFGQKRAIAANGRDIVVDRVWCEEVFTPGQDSQCVGAWNGGLRVTIRHSYLAAAAENILIGGAPVAAAALQPSDWTITDVILHKPLRWKQDGRHRTVKNLLELKHGARVTVQRVLAVNNWRDAQTGRGLVIHYTTNGTCPECGNLEQVRVEDFVMLNVEAGISFQGYSYQPESRSEGRLRDVSLRHLFVQITGGGRLLEIYNVRGAHDIRIERSTFLNGGTTWLLGAYGWAWQDDETRIEGGPMRGLRIVDNVIAANGRYGVTAPERAHYGTGLGRFVDGGLVIAGNVIGDAPDEHLDHYNDHTGGGASNVSVSGDTFRLPDGVVACRQWRDAAGADCTRLAPVFALLKRLPEP